MDKNTQQKEQVSQKTHSQKKKYKNKSHKRDNHKKDSNTPKWDIEKSPRDIEISATKADLMSILEDVDPDELLMTSLVQQSRTKALPTMAPKKDPVNLMDSFDSIDPENPENPDQPISEDPTVVKIDLTLTCPICEKPMREIMYALHDYEHDSLAHFDCVHKKVIASVKEKLTPNRYLAYLGSGSFGIMESGKDKKSTQLIEKIYPGAPLEELLSGDDQQKLLDEEL